MARLCDKKCARVVVSCLSEWSMMYALFTACLGIVAWETLLSEDQRGHVRAGARTVLDDCRRRLADRSS